MSERTAVDMGQTLSDPSEPDSGEADGDTETTVHDSTEDMARSKSGPAGSTTGAVMSDQLDEFYDGLGDLTAHKRTADLFWILSRRNGSLTLYEVNLSDLTCSCPDETFNREDNEPCAHLAKVILVEGNRPSETRAVEDLKREVERAERTLGDLMNAVNVERRTRQANTVAVETDSSEEEAPEMDDDAAIEAAENWLESNGFDPEQFRCWVESGQLRIEKDGNLSDKDWDSWTTASWKPDGMGYDSDNYYNFISLDDVEEVLG